MLAARIAIWFRTQNRSWSASFVLAVIFSVWLNPGPVTAAPSYEGPLFDAHAHLSKRAKPREALKDFKAAGFNRAILFADIARVDDIGAAAGDFFLVFADPFKRKKVRVSKGVKEVRYIFSPERLTDIEEKLNSGDVGGFGEIYFRLGWAPFARDGISTDIHGDGATRLLSVARSFNTTVHIHLDAEHVGTLKALLTAYPEVRFVLAHCGFFTPEHLGGLLDEHDNLFGEVSLIFNPFIKKFANPPLENGKLKPDWKAVLIRHADRLLIGTDYAGWRAEQLPDLASYYRKVLGLLPADVADKIAHGNFIRLFIEPARN